MRAFTHDQNGQEITTNFYAKNMVVFEVASLFHRTISKENIQAVTDCKGLVLTFDELNSLFHGIPEFREFGRAMLVNGFIMLKKRMLSMINETAEERYANLLQHNPEVFQYAHLKDIATFLGVTDTSLSRIRKQFAKNKSFFISCHLASAISFVQAFFVLLINFYCTWKTYQCTSAGFL